ncbi:response regulator [Spirosoma sp. HMF4905]|uniref:Response regulator n=1 Tax=Spirosoma arboris TaxID=2682092 RepID=A0A7K1SB82_9BACT|nr:LytTR family DNA-binding domain-containing protein [Spirosoma arboris]MVM30928.1 response regulator [Spirosoma arboris]
MLKAIALDADPLALEILNTFCQQMGTVAIAQTFTHSSEARHYLHVNPVDLVFMEIDLPTESGIDFWQSIRQHGTGYAEADLLPMVIFTTASTDFALISYELQAIDYLLKPFTVDRFHQAIQKATNYASCQQPPHSQPTTYLSVRVDAGLVRIKLADIAWIEALSNYLKIHLSDQSFLVVRMTMKAMLQELPSTDFIRVHRSYIVPIHRVQAIHNKLIRIGEKRIPLSSYYDDQFVERVQEYQPSSQFLPLSSHRQLPLQQA